MHSPKSFLSSISRAAVLIFDLFPLGKSKTLAERGFSFARVPGNQNRSPVLIFDLFRVWKSRRRGNPGFSHRLRAGNQNLAGGASQPHFFRNLKGDETHA